MNVKEMHYDFKKKLNKIDSEQYRNLLVPEIDWVLNEAQELFIKLIAEPRSYSYLGFEKSQRNTDDIRTLVQTSSLAVVNDVVTLPSDYMYFISAKVTMHNDKCGDREATLYIRQHDDEFENSVFDKSSFDWQVVNGVFEGDELILSSGTDFTNTYLDLTYIRRPRYICNPKDFNSNGYDLPGGRHLSVSQDCELPEQTHRAIVDFAVQIASGELETNGYQIHSQKTKYELQ